MVIFLNKWRVIFFNLMRPKSIWRSGRFLLHRWLRWHTEPLWSYGRRVRAAYDAPIWTWFLPMPLQRQDVIVLVTFDSGRSTKSGQRRHPSVEAWRRCGWPSRLLQRWEGHLGGGVLRWSSWGSRLGTGGGAKAGRRRRVARYVDVCFDGEKGQGNGTI
jgi:hypothetical protein